MQLEKRIWNFSIWCAFNLIGHWNTGRQIRLTVCGQRFHGIQKIDLTILLGLTDAELAKRKFGLRGRA